MEELTIEASVENLPKVTEFITDLLESKDCPMKVVMQMELIIEEAFVNVANYAYAPQTGFVTIRVSFEENPQAVILTFIDCGAAFNPLEHKDPDTSLGVEEREIGGLGILLIKKNTDAINYERKDEKNILTLKKFF